jgi:methylglutaconyl-CoA hydratase
VPACISPYLIRKVPEGVLKELFISGLRFDAQKALDGKLVNYVVPLDQLMDFTRTKAAELKKCGPNAIALCKQLFYDVPEMSLKEAYDHTADVIARLRISDEAQEGMKAFLEKRDPAWKEE